MAVNFSNQIASFATRVGTECKTLHNQIGVLTSLSTSDKTSLVAAINEVKSTASGLQSTLNSVSSTLDNVKNTQSTHSADISTAKSNISTLQGNIKTINASISSLEESLNSYTQIDDSKTTATTTWSSNKISSSISSAASTVKNELLNGAGAAYDTLKELGDLITTNQGAIEALQKLAAGHVKFDEVQSLTTEQKTQARTNIGAASLEDVSTIPSLTQRLSAVESKASTNASNHSTLVTNLGDLTTNFVTTFETALTPGK